VFRTIPIKITITFITGMEKSTLKFMWKHKRLLITKAILRKKSNAGVTTTPNFKLYYKVICFWHLCQKWGGHNCMDSYPGPLFCSTGLHVYFCANTMLFLLLLLCNVVWSQVLWYLQHCPFCWLLPWLFMVSCVSKWALG
jgi:hypothetical protein